MARRRVSRKGRPRGEEKNERRRNPKNKPPIKPKIKTKKPIVLIVGDSFIDENWLMSRVETYHSYNVGEEHYVGDLKDTLCQIISLCGAANVWRILTGPESSPNPDLTLMPDRYNLITLSAWNPQDGDLLPCLVCEDAKSDNPERSYSQYLISGTRPPERAGRTVKCLSNSGTDCKYNGCLQNLVANTPRGKKLSSTNHLIRLYEGFGGDQPKLQYRFDWRLDLEPKCRKRGFVRELRKKLKGKGAVEAIVAVDHGYGVLNDRFVMELRSAFPRANWYVRSKLESAPWKRRLPKHRVRLVFTDEQLLEYQYGLRPWRHGNTVLGRGALEVLGELLALPWWEHGKEKKPKAGSISAESAAVLFEDDTVIAASRLSCASRGHGSRKNLTKNDAVLVNISSAPGEKKAIKVGRSTVFFASLVYWDLMKKAPLRDSMREAAEWALGNSYEWSLACTKAWHGKQPTKLSGPFDTAIYPASDRLASRPKRKTDTDKPKYLATWDDWKQSSERLGVVKVGREKQIHLWRAQGTLKDYICPGGQKRTDINTLISRLKTYRSERKSKYPFNCLLLAEPGWGKSFLAECMANYFDFQFLSFSVAQMLSNQDLLDCFKAIISAQNRSKDRLLIFVDEIDAEIESHSAMGLLLGPIWGGAFMAEGKFYRIDPAAWVFASTKPRSRLLTQPKGRDFLSRINAPIIDLDFFAKDREALQRIKSENGRRSRMKEVVLRPENRVLRTEMVYHGVNFLNRTFGPISTIDESVLQVFYDSMPMDGIRSIEIFVSRFRDISRGHVSWSSVPSFKRYPELERHIYPLRLWKEPKHGERVTVIKDPPPAGL